MAIISFQISGAEMFWVKYKETEIREMSIKTSEVQ